MARFKDFGSPKLSDDQAEPLKFRLHGEEFSCIPQVPGKVMLDFAAKTGKDDPGADGAAVVVDFFKTVMYPESYTRFDILASDRDKIVTIEQLMEIIEWLMENYSNRPTQRSEDSSTGE